MKKSIFLLAASSLMLSLFFLSSCKKEYTDSVTLPSVTHIDLAGLSFSNASVFDGNYVIALHTSAVDPYYCSPLDESFDVLFFESWNVQLLVAGEVFTIAEGGDIEIAAVGIGISMEELYGGDQYVFKMEAEEGGNVIPVESGTIEITSLSTESKTMTLKYNVTLSNGQKLSGTYSGSYCLEYDTYPFPY